MVKLIQGDDPEWAEARGLARGTTPLPAGPGTLIPANPDRCPAPLLAPAALS